MTECLITLFEKILKIHRTITFSYITRYYLECIKFYVKDRLFHNYEIVIGLKLQNYREKNEAFVRIFQINRRSSSTLYEL